MFEYNRLYQSYSLYTNRHYEVEDWEEESHRVVVAHHQVLSTHIQRVKFIKKIGDEKHLEGRVELQFVEDRHEDVAGDEADGGLWEQHRRVLRAEHVNLSRHPQHRHPREVAAETFLFALVFDCGLSQYSSRRGDLRRHSFIAQDN